MDSLFPFFTMELEKLWKPYLSEGYVADVPQVWSLPPEVLVRLVPDDEDDVCWYLVGGLVPLPLKGDLRTRLPAGLHVDRQHLHVK